MSANTEVEAETSETISTLSLTDQIRKELKKNFKNIDDEVLSYLIGVIDMNKEDLHSVEDMHEAIGAILCELANDSEEDYINDLCETFLHLIKW
jgi:FPC/CPF motif-containing protein YcgG